MSVAADKAERPAAQAPPAGAVAAGGLPCARRAVPVPAGRRRPPSKLPSALIGRPVPCDTAAARSKTLCATASRCQASTAPTSRARYSLVNVRASWRVPCCDEAPLLMNSPRTGACASLGINYKDKPDNARRSHIGRYGNPFAAVGNGPQRPRLDRVGRLWRAGDLRDRPRRQHRLQAGRADLAGRSSSNALKPQIEKALAAPQS